MCFIFQRHEIVKHGDKPAFQCTVCNRLLTTKYSLAVHMRKHFTIKEEVESTEYEQKLSTDVPLENMQGRQSSIVSDIAYQYDCGECEEGFDQAEDLNTHLKTHSKPITKPYKCSDCYKSFSIK